MKGKVVVAMSGGVDSSVAAALLKRDGYDVTGMMLRLWTEPGRESANRCCTPAAMSLARSIALQLEIPFYVVDAKDVFEREIVSYFVEEYKRGATPNPCVRCNRHIRWEYLLNRALSIGADYMATGHYARVSRDAGGNARVFRAVDPEKDQSYVLFGLQPEQLKHALFPVGEYRKSEVRSLAEEFALPVAKVKDSQDLCFLAGTTYNDFLSRNAPEANTPGNILDTNGNLIGQHQGLASYTIGQRRRLGISSETPLFVVNKNVATNELIVGPLESLGSASLIAGEVNWHGDPPTMVFEARVKTRYTAKPIPALVTLLPDKRIRIDFEHPVRDLTPGQAAVIYLEDELIGGGTIEGEGLPASPVRPIKLLNQS